MLQNLLRGIPGGSDGKESSCNAEDPGSIPGLGRYPGEGRGNPLQYSCLENSSKQRSQVGYGPWDRKESDTTEQLAHAWWKSVMWCHMVVSLVGAVAHHPCVQTCSEHVRAKCQEKLFFPWETDPLLPTSPPSTSRYGDTTVCRWAWKISFLLSFTLAAKELRAEYVAQFLSCFKTYLVPSVTPFLFISILVS